MPKPTKRSHPADVPEAGPSRKKPTRPINSSKPQNYVKAGKAIKRNEVESKARKQKEDSVDEESDEESDEEMDDDDDEVGAMSGESDTSSDEDDEEDDDDDDDDLDSNAGPVEEESDDEDIPVSLEDCLEKPIYTLEEVDVKDSTPVFAYQGCILCPSKILKNQTMVDVHIKSNTHMRAKRRMAERLLDPDSITSEDPRIIVAEIEAGLFEQRGGVDRQRQVDGHGEKGKADKKGGDEKENVEEIRAKRKKDRQNKVALKIEARKARRAARGTEGTEVTETAK